MALIGLVPARGGSKGIPRKNLAMCGGKPLLAWTAEAAHASAVLDEVILSTDDPEIAEAGRRLGLDVPFLRPSELAADTAGMLGVMTHALGALRARGVQVEGLVLLQPTSPFRQPRHIAEAADLFRSRNAATVVSVVRVPHNFLPTSQMRDVGGRLVPFQPGEPGPLRRQDKAVLFARNGPAVLIVRPDVLDSEKLYGEPTLGYEMELLESLDVDGAQDLWLADRLLRGG